MPCRYQGEGAKKPKRPTEVTDVLHKTKHTELTDGVGEFTPGVPPAKNVDR